MFGKFKYRKKNNAEIEIVDNWAQENIVNVKIPQLIGVEGAPKDGVIKFHKKGVEQLKGFFEEVERRGLKHLIISWAGSFYPRFIRGSSSRLSNHSFGTAIDMNAPQNWLGQSPAKVGQKGSILEIVSIANSFGFYWGGHYNGRKDGMHFELAKLDRFPKKITSNSTPSIFGLNSHDDEIKDSSEPVEYEILDSSLPQEPLEETTDVSEVEQVENTSDTQEDTASSTSTEVTVKDGDVSVSTGKQATLNEKIAIEKPEPKNFLEKIRTRIGVLTGGNITIQALKDYGEQAQFLGLSSNFWLWLGIIIAVASTIYIVLAYLKHRADEKRDLEITNELVKANTTDYNLVKLVDKENVEEYKSLGYKIITR